MNGCIKFILSWIGIGSGVSIISAMRAKSKKEEKEFEDSLEEDIKKLCDESTKYHKYEAEMAFLEARYEPRIKELQDILNDPINRMNVIRDEKLRLLSEEYDELVLKYVNERGILFGKYFGNEGA